MTVQINTLAAWQETRDTLVHDLSLSYAAQQDAPFSDDPTSPYQVAQGAINQTLTALQRLAVTGLKLLDASVASGPLITEIDALSARARYASQQIANAATSVNAVASAVSSAVAVVDKFLALPVLGLG